MEVLWSKLLCIPLILLVNFLFGLLPFCIYHAANKKKTPHCWKSSSGGPSLTAPVGSGRQVADAELHLDQASEPLLNNSTAEPRKEVKKSNKIRASCHGVPQSHNTSDGRMSRWLSMANCFCAGVFLSTCFVGLLPSVQSKWRHMLRNWRGDSSSTPQRNHGVTSSASMKHGMASMEGMSKEHLPSEYPLPEVCVCLGLFLVWVLEVLLHACLGQRRHNARSKKRSPKEPGVLNHKKRRSDLLEPSASLSSTSSRLSFEEKEDGNEAMKGAVSRHQSQEMEMAQQRVWDAETGGPEGDNATRSLPPTTPASSSSRHSLIKSLLLLMALSSHSFIEGVAFGLLDEAHQVMNLAVAMLLHESLCAFCLSVSLARDSGLSRGAGILMLVTFALLIPVGIAMGLLLFVKAETSFLGEAVSMVLQGMASGTFIYIVFFEILPMEIKRDAGGAHHHLGEQEEDTDDEEKSYENLKDTLLKMLLCVLGFLTIALLRLLHSH